MLQLLHERRTRVFRQENVSGWGWDLTRHWGGSFGNFATYANVGENCAMACACRTISGTAPLRPAGENTSPVRTTAGSNWNGHLFVALDARWVLHDITLDGNTFKSSHSVDRRPFVADVGYGIAMTQGNWRIAIARYHRTREFRGTRRNPGLRNDHCRTEILMQISSFLDSTRAIRRYSSARAWLPG